MSKAEILIYSANPKQLQNSRLLSKNVDLAGYLDKPGVKYDKVIKV